MKFTGFGLLIRVGDLALCRTFYRDLLHLGEPVMDSGFAVEFRLAGGMTLRLEENNLPALEHASAAVSWTLDCDDPEKLFDELANAGYDVTPVAEPHDSGAFFRGLDPEGNPFYVARA